MLAAATYTAIGDITSTIRVLDMNGEVDLAAALAGAFNEEDSNMYLLSLARSLGDSGMIENAIEVLSSLPAANEEIAQLLIRCCRDEADATEWITKLKIKSINWYAQNASQEESIGADYKAVLNYSLSWQFSKAGMNSYYHNYNSIIYHIY